MTGPGLPVPVVEEGARLLVDGGSVSFVGIISSVSGHASVHAITAEKLAVGSFAWGSNDDGVVTGIHVHPEFRRRGIGRLLWTVAVELAEARGWEPPRHSPHRTMAGDRFAHSVGGSLPDLAEGQLAEAMDDGFTRT